jgi:disulfide bond formation protein DsbB
MKNKTSPVFSAWNLLFFTWLVATSATLVSLFFSEIVQLPVCVLCWYQRIAMYPLVLILPLALFPYDIKVIKYAGILVAFGLLSALYHVLLVAGIIPESAQPCVQGIPCSEVNFMLFGYLNIPIMSLLSFILLAILLTFSNLQFKRDHHE